MDRLERTSLSDDILGLPNLEDLGVKPAKVTDKMPFELLRRSAFMSHFPETPDDIPNPPPPKALSRLEEKEIRRLAKTSPFEAIGIA